jgi:Spy/CpxP family protein refolding chaperone
MKYSVLFAAVLSLCAGTAFAADAVPAKKPETAKRFVHHRKDCHFEHGMGYGMGHGMGGGMGYGMGYGHGMGYGRGMMGGMDVKMLGPRTAIVWSLDLTSEQRGKIDKLIEQLQHDNWGAMGTIMDDTGVLRDLYHADRRDSVAIDKTYKRIFDLKRQMIKSALDTETEIENLLTPDQMKQFMDRLHMAPPPYPGR